MATFTLARYYPTDLAQDNGVATLFWRGQAKARSRTDQASAFQRVDDVQGYDRLALTLITPEDYTVADIPTVRLCGFYTPHATVTLLTLLDGSSTPIENVDSGTIFAAYASLAELAVCEWYVIEVMFRGTATARHIGALTLLMAARP